MNKLSATDHLLNTSIDVALNTWAVAVQLSILVVFTAVFLVLWNQFPRRDVFFWLLAWAANLLALLCIFAVLASTRYLADGSLKAIYLLYACAKIWFAVLLIIGLGRHLNRLDIFSINVIKWMLVFTLVGALSLLISPLNTLHIQILVYLLVGSILFTGGGYFLVKGNFHPGRWIQNVMALEGLVFLHHGFVLLPTLWGQAVPAYMTRISFFDSISELIVGITCVLAVSRRVIQEIQSRNAELEVAQKSLRELVDEDPLTGLWNRRKLESFELEQGATATLVYVDVDRFKQINDQWGHAVGDLCLSRIADAMRRHFDQQADLYRLGGDEFLAIIKNQSFDAISTKIVNFQQELTVAQSSGPAIHVSLGMKTMTDQHSLKQAIHDADEAMYRNKHG